MATHFDADAGLLRVPHGALAVLAVLATDPTSTRLHDHDVAPLLAELRGAGLVDGRGIHPDVEPLAAAVGDPRITGELDAWDHGTRRGARLWGDDSVGVVGVHGEEDPHTYELMADASVRLPGLLAELVGLTVVPPPAAHGDRTVADDAMDALWAATGSVTPAQVAAITGEPGEEAWTAALAAALTGSAVRWRVTARRVDSGEAILDLAALDAGDSGLWVGRREAAGVSLGPASREAVLALLARLGGPHG